MADFQSLSHREPVLERFSTWPSILRGAGVAVLRTSIIIASGGRWHAGCLTNVIWPQEKGYDFSIPPNDQNPETLCPSRQMLSILTARHLTMVFYKLISRHPTVRSNESNLQKKKGPGEASLDALKSLNQVNGISTHSSPKNLRQASRLRLFLKPMPSKRQDDRPALKFFKKCLKFQEAAWLRPKKSMN